MSEHFSDRTRSATERAAEEARRLRHAGIGDAHLLLGLLHGRRGLAARVLKRHGVELEASRTVLSSIGSPSHETAEDELLPLELSAKRALQLALHEAFERCDNRIRAAHLLAGTIAVDGTAANVIRAQGARPSDLADALRAKLGAANQEGIKLLEDRVAVLEAYLRAAERREEVTRIISQAPAREAARREIATLLDLSDDQMGAVADMPLDMTTEEGVVALEAERGDLKQRLSSLGQG